MAKLIGKNVALLLALAGILLFTGCGQNAPLVSRLEIPVTGWQLQDIAKLPADATGEQISRPGFSTTDWYKATVPGTVLTSLVDDGVYPEPLYGENNRPDKIPESLCRTSYWYRAEFPAPTKNADGERTWLNFDGINYIAEIYVNGRNAGTIKGAFARGNFDVTPFVTPGEPMAVAVHIIPPPDPGATHEKTVARGTGPNGGILAQDGPNFLSSIGWDWIPTIRDRNIGIWQKVTVSQSGPVTIENPQVTSDLPLPRSDSADLTVAGTLHNLSDQRQSGVLHGTIGDIQFSTSVQLQAHEMRLVHFTPADSPALHVLNPKLWWPNGYGPQNLYDLHLQFESGGAFSDSQNVTFGIRKITYSVPDSQNLTICVNGVPIICKGGDWGIDEAMKRSPRSRLEAQIRLHQLANYTMIRNWVGQSTSEDFYDLCDKYGILIWDEMFQPNPSDGPNPVDPALYLANVREKVIRFRNHPSIALWCGRNEGNPPPSVEAGIRSIMTELDPTRMYHPNSNDGSGVRSGGPYSWRMPKQFYTFPATEAFKTELGSVSIPTLQSVQAMMPEKDWDIFADGRTAVNDDWAEHDLTRGAQEGRGDLLYPQLIADRYGKLNGLADFVRKAQLANYEAYRAMYEGRFAKLFHPVTGVLTWMSNPAQPSMVWQIYSHDLEPNASLFAARKACEPIHVQVNQSDFHVMVINATPAAQSGLHIRLRLFNMDGYPMADRDIPVNAAALGATDAGAIDWPAGLTTVHFIKTELFDSGNKLLSDNFYWRSLKTLSPATLPSAGGNGGGGGPRGGQRPSREDFTDLQNMPPADITCTMTRHDQGEKCLLDATVINNGSNIALLVHLQLRKASSHDRVLPV